MKTTGAEEFSNADTASGFANLCRERFDEFAKLCLRDGWTGPVSSGMRHGWFYNSYEDYLDGKFSRFGIVNELDEFIAESPFRENRVSRWFRNRGVELIHTTDETEQAIKEQIAAGKALEVFDVTSIT